MSWRHGGNGPTPSDGAPMRKINGPLGDLWKKMTKFNQQPNDLTVHDALGLEEHTEFEHGPWIEMCQFMGIAATEGQVNGGVDLGRLPMNTEQVALGFQSTGVIEQDFMLLIRTSKYVDEEIVATFHDPLGCIDGYFHRDVVEAVGAALVKGTAIILRNVTVFMPVERRQQYLNICRSNIVRIFPSSSQYADDVDAFNTGQAAVVGPPAGASPFVLEDPSGEATTAADLVAMTQRHVINQSHAQRAPPTGGHKGKQKWAWKSFVPKKKKKRQSGQDDESPPQPSPASSASPATPLPTRPAAKPRRAPSFESPPPLARPLPPAPLTPVPVARQVIQPAQPSPPVPTAKTTPVTGTTQRAPPATLAPIEKTPPVVDKTPVQPPPKAALVGPGDAISLAVDAALDDDDW